MNNYVPRWLRGGGHWMTIYCWAKRRAFPTLPPPDERLFEVAPETRVLAHCHWHAAREDHPALILLHGLEGSSAAHYMRGIADKAYRTGFNVVRLNQRNCGGTEHLGPGLYHSGLTHDADYVLQELVERDRIRQIVVAGYSLGGNLALKLAGDYGDAPPPALRGVAAVSPVIELEACVRALERRSNAIYQWNFVRGLKTRMRRKEQCFPGRFALTGLDAITTVRQFDAAFTAPHFGFASAEDYYHRASAHRVAERIRVPALVITAEDDPFVPTEPFRAPQLAANPFVRLHITAHGGHCGFVAPSSEGDDGYWAERQIVEFAREVCTRPEGGAR